MNKFKFLMTLFSILTDQRGELSVGSAPIEEVTDVAETNPEAEVSQGEEGTDQPETESPDYEKVLEGIETNDEGLLESLNGLGIVRNGDMVKFESLDAAREILSKGYDYTAKTQELSEQKKAFEAEMQTMKEAFEQEKADYAANTPQIADLQYENEFFTNWMTQLKETDPDLFQDFANAYNGAIRQRDQIQNNPVLQTYKQEIDGLKNEVNQFKQSRFQEENKEILSEFDKGYETELSAMAPRLASAGIFVNKGKVQEMWKSSDNMTPRQAIFAVYGEALVKAEQSSAKLVKTKLQSERRTGGIEKEETPSNAKGRTYEDIRQGWLKKLSSSN